MTWIRVLIWLLPRRLRSSWMLLAVISFGILAAVTLMAVGAIYSKTLAEGGLRHTLALTSQTGLNAQVVIQNRPLGPADYQTLRITVEETIGARLGHMIQSTQRSGRAHGDLPLMLTPDGQPSSRGGPRGQPFFLTDFEKHVRIVEGRWPQATPVFHDKGVNMEVVVGRQTAFNMGWEVDTQVYMVPFRADPSERVAFTVVGLVEAIDPSEEYWMTSANYYFEAQDVDPWTVAPIYVPEEDFFNGLGARYPSLLGNYWWFLFRDTDALTADTAGPTKEAIVGLEKNLNKLFPRSLVLSLLEKTITDYQRELTLARVPLFLFLSLVVVVILYFLVLVLGLLARTQSDAANILRSRGASMLQVSGLFALGEGIVVLLSLFLGPFLALGIVRYLLAMTITPAGEGGPLPVDLSVNVFLIGAIGGLFSLAVLIASGVGLARLGIVEFLRIRARPPTVPLMHRYYVDVLVLATVGLIWWQIEESGGFLQRELSGSALREVDLSMLLGPVLVLLAVAFLIPRLLPWLMKALALAGKLAAPAWVSLTLTRMARDPLPHGSLVIILMMVAALGVFGATFQSTLSRSQQEQTLFSMGGELVVRGSSFSDSIQEDLASMPGVQAVSPVVRDLGTIVGIDPHTLPDTTWFRDDFAATGLAELLTPLRQAGEVSPGITLPVDTESVGVWIRVNELFQGMLNRTQNILVRVTDASETYLNVSLGEIPSAQSSQDWTYLEAALPLEQTALKPPFSVVAIFMSGRYGGSLGGLQPGSFSLDDMTAKGPYAPLDGLVVEGFEESENANTWVSLPSLDSATDSTERTQEAARSGGFGLTFSWRDALGNAPRGILVPAIPIPLPAIGGPTYQTGQRPRIESVNQMVPVLVRNVTDYFPSVTQPSRPFLLVNMEDYRRYVTRMPDSERLSPPNELWVSLNDSVSRGSAILSIKRLPGVASVQDRDAEVELAQRNPLAGGGWNGLTILSMSVLTMAVAVALGTYSAISVQTGRIDLTISGALGLSRVEVLLSLVLERFVVAVIGIGVGSAVGVWLSRWVLGFLDVTIDGSPVIPPMILTTNGGLMALVYIDLAAALAISVLVTMLSIRKLNAPDILRTGA
ncbi:MAG: ABC transporter permease [Chloroflexi bacterium]|nr:ABC transporter permease [Chloroflexota bacterium]